MRTSGLLDLVQFRNGHFGDEVTSIAPSGWSLYVAILAKLRKSGIVLVITANNASAERGFDDLQTYLDAYSELYGPLSAPDVSYPFQATRHNVVFVADRPRTQGARP